MTTTARRFEIIFDETASVFELFAVAADGSPTWLGAFDDHRAAEVAAAKAHPAFAELVRLERERRAMIRRPGGRSALAANSRACFNAEATIAREARASIAAVAGAALAAI
jgi:hypothetical protein